MKNIDIKSIEKSKSITDKAKELKERIIKNANDLADRILDKAIAREEAEKQWAEKKEELLKKATELRKKAAQEKRDRRNNQRLEINKTIPFCHVGKFANPEDVTKYNDYIAAVRKRQEELANKAKAESKKEEAVEKKHDKKDTVKRTPAMRTTKDERIQAAIEKKIQGKANYRKELQKQASEIEADPKGYQERQQKKQKSEQERLDMLAAKRKERLEKKIKNELTTKQLVLKQINDFKESQKKRLEKKDLKRAKYITKGGEKVNKFKIKTPLRPSVIIEKKDTELNSYNVVIARVTDKNTIIDSKPQIVKCKSNTLSDHIKDIHNTCMKDKNNENYVGTFVYPIDQPDHCIFEMINSKKLNIEGKLTSRIASQRETKAA